MMVSRSFHNDFKTAVLLGMPFSFPLKYNSRNWLISNNNNNNNNNNNSDDDNHNDNNNNNIIIIIITMYVKTVTAHS